MSWRDGAAIACRPGSGSLAAVFAQPVPSPDRCVDHFVCRPDEDEWACHPTVPTAPRGLERGCVSVVSGRSGGRLRDASGGPGRCPCQRVAVASGTRFRGHSHTSHTDFRTRFASRSSVPHVQTPKYAPDHHAPGRACGRCPCEQSALRPPTVREPPRHFGIHIPVQLTP